MTKTTTRWENGKTNPRLSTDAPA